MKLLSKQEITRQRSSERKMDIDEGIKLARKIDTLRETSAVEEARLKKYKEESIKKTHEEISSLIDKKNELKKEVQTLKDQKKALRIPLDAEWEQVTNEMESVRLANERLEKAEIELKDKQTFQENKEQMLAADEIRMNLEKERIETLVTEARDKVKLAEQGLAGAIVKSQELSKYHAERSHSLLARESAIAIKERDFVLKEEQYNKDIQDLEYTRRMIDDRYQTLLRTENRLKNHA